MKTTLNTTQPAEHTGDASQDRPFVAGIVTALSTLLVLPTFLLFRAERALAGDAAAGTGLSERMAQWPGTLGIFRRRRLINLVCAKANIGRNLMVSTGTLITKLTLVCGNDVYIGRHSVVGDVTIGSDVMIGDQVHLLSGGHVFDRLDELLRFQPDTDRKLTIGADTWIGSGAIILADVGSHCVVGAGSVVTKPVLDYQVVVGNPARLIRDRRDAK